MSHTYFIPLAIVLFAYLWSSLMIIETIFGQVNVGLECGIGIDSFLDWEEGDILEAFNTVKKKRTLEEASATMAAAIEGMGIGR